MPRRRASRFRSRDRLTTVREWVGGWLSPPFFVTDRDEPYRPELAIWVEEPSGLIVGQDVISPGSTEGAVGRVLRASMERPLAGSPRSPDRIRVANASLAAEVRAAVGDAIPVTVAPTPELDALLVTMLESMPGGGVEESYLEDGRVPPSAVSELFAAAQLLYRIAPWKVASDDQVLRMDIPQLAVEAACVSIIGNLGQSLGFLVFWSLAGYEAFEAAAQAPRRRTGRLDLGTDFLALGFERAADLPTSMRREAMAHGWPVAQADAYPRVERCERDGASRPLVERDLKIATAGAASLSTFFAKHRKRFEADDVEPVCESYFDEDDLEVRFTMPYEAFPLFEVNTGPRPERPSAARVGRARVGRNDPCPCGSGRKYKKCHLPLDEQQDVASRVQDAHHDLSERLVGKLREFAMSRFGDAWGGFAADFVDSAEALQLSGPWSVYHYCVDGMSVLDRYLEEQGQHLPRAARAWLAAQQAAWLSVWEVTQVEPGSSVTLRDLLADETRLVREVSGSQTLVVRDALLGRVVDYDGASLLCGVHPRPLPPLDAADVVRRARGRLRRKRAVPVERLRDEAFGRYLIKRWEETVAEADVRWETPTDLRNTAGDPILLTTDHFEIGPGMRPAVEAKLAALEGVEPPDPAEDPPVYVFLRPGNPLHPSWETTMIGQARIVDGSLRLETNSRTRADALRERVEAACGDGVRHRAREHTDPLSHKAPFAERDQAIESLPDEAQQLALEFKQRHYRDWLDQPIPALAGKTPREATRTAKGRAVVDVLLKDMENREQRSAGDAPFDFSVLRTTLRLD